MSCQVEESATVVSFNEYEPGLSAVFLVNDTDENIYLRQEFSGSSSRCVEIGQSVHYAWEDPRENRQLVCWIYDNDVCKVGPLTVGSIDHRKTKTGSESGKSGSTAATWFGRYFHKAQKGPPRSRRAAKFYLKYSLYQDTSSSDHGMAGDLKPTCFPRTRVKFSKSDTFSNTSLGRRGPKVRKKHINEGSAADTAKSTIKGGGFAAKEAIDVEPKSLGSSMKPKSEFKTRKKKKRQKEEPPEKLCALCDERIAPDKFQEGAYKASVLLQDASGKIKLPHDKVIFWASFLDGKQRVLYFTKDSDHMIKVEKVGALERCNTEFQLEYRGIGISLVDDEPKRREILYVSVTGSGVQWLSRSKHKTKYKPINSELNAQVRIPQRYE